jgi:maltose alpha-D-glucosyltransferase / alpha-amylase
MSTVLMPEMETTQGMVLRAPSPATADPDDPQWYRRAVVYQVHVRSFFDSNGDGVGDFPGLIQKLDYIQDLGATALWLLPFYRSPLKDDGYDISDYRGIHPAYGTLRDFQAFLREAHRRGLRVITELVLNHTSDQHPWFRRARSSPAGSRWREFYVWSDRPDKYRDARIIFPADEPSNWTWDPVAGAYYWHRFYHHQPDLNFDHPPVRQAVLQVLDYWLRMGVDGLRLNAAPYLFEREGTNCENLAETHQFLNTLRRHVDERFHGRMLLAEANQWPEDTAAYFGEGDECHAAFHFPLMPRLYMAVSTEDRGPVADMLEQTPDPPEGSQWFLFLRNHDELTLEMVTEEERLAMYRHYALDPRARVHRGIRRRLAPLLGDRRRIELLTALLLSLPGTPVLYYGDEIGMGDNIYLGDRDGVRTPMQWSPDRNAGFSGADCQQLSLPPIRDARYHYETVNVANQLGDPSSLLSWTRRAVALRRQTAALADGSLEVLHPENRKVFAFLRHGGDAPVLVVANLSHRVQVAQLDLARFHGRVPVELFGQEPFPPAGELPYMLTLAPYGFFWLALRPAEQMTDQWGPRIGHSLPSGPPPAVIDLDGPPESVFDAANRDLLERLLPSFLSTRRWFGGKARALRSAQIADVVPARVTVAGAEVRFALVDVSYFDTEDERYLMPLAISGAERLRTGGGLPADAVVAEVRSSGDGFVQAAVLYDVFGEEEFSHGLLDAIGSRGSLRGRHGRVQSRASRVYRQLRPSPGEKLPAKAMKAETSNSTVLFGNRFILKLFRRLDEGTNPEQEIGAFLTDEVAFANVPPVAGAIEYLAEGREPSTVALLSGFVRNEGSAWDHALESLGRFFERIAAGEEVADPPGGVSAPELLGASPAAEPPPPVREQFGAYLRWAALLGRRTAELHLALATDVGNPAFSPEPFSRLYQRSLYQSLRNQTNRAREFLTERLDALPPEGRASAERVLEAGETIDCRLRELLQVGVHAMRIRCHGDYHLGQVLFTGNDFVIIDFEGEPARPIAERKLKTSPLRDVAGMVRSFDYACHVAEADLLRGLVVPDVERAKLERWMRLWVGWVGATYVGTYLGVAAGASFLPERPESLRALLDAFLLEKALYELQYELNNRPGWAHIPLGGILRLLP